MRHEIAPTTDYEAWEAANRAEKIPEIYAAFAARGQTREDADRYIALLCFEHPTPYLRRNCFRK